MTRSADILDLDFGYSYIKLPQGTYFIVRVDLKPNLISIVFVKCNPSQLSIYIN